MMPCPVQPCLSDCTGAEADSILGLGPACAPDGAPEERAPGNVKPAVLTAVGMSDASDAAGTASTDDSTTKDRTSTMDPQDASAMQNSSSATSGVELEIEAMESARKSIRSGGKSRQSVRSSLSEVAGVANIRSTLSIPPEEDDDPELRGQVLQKEDEGDLTTSIASSRKTSAPVVLPMKDKIKLILTITAHFPAHWFFEVRYVVAPLIVALIPVVLKGVTSRLAAALEMSGDMYDFTSSVDQPIGVSWSHAAHGMSLGLSNLATATSVVCTLWSWKCVRNTIRKATIPYITTWCCVWVLYWVEHRNMPDGFIFLWLMLLTDFVVAPFAVLGTWLGAGIASRNPAFSWTLAGCNVLMLILATMYSAKWSPIGARIIIAFPWMIKAFFLVGNAIFIELSMLTPARFVARSLRHNDSSTSFLCLITLITFKQTFTRFVIATVSVGDVLMVSTIASAGDFLTKVSQRRRDRMLDDFWARHFPRKGQTEETRLARTFRNRRLRATTAAFTTLSDIVCIWTGVAFVLALDISRDGASPNIMDGVMSGMIQTGTEIFTDYLGTLAVGISQGTSNLEQVRGRTCMWSLYTVAAFFSSSIWLSHSLGGHLACREPGTHESTWYFCTN